MNHFSNVFQHGYDLNVQIIRSRRIRSPPHPHPMLKKIADFPSRNEKIQRRRHHTSNGHATWLTCLSLSDHQWVDTFPWKQDKSLLWKRSYGKKIINFIMFYIKSRSQHWMGVRGWWKINFISVKRHIWHELPMQHWMGVRGSESVQYFDV